jgi:GxxExxY protein
MTAVHSSPGASLDLAMESSGAGAEDDLMETIPKRATRDLLPDVIINAALQVHRDLGPGLLEHVYEVVFARELECRGLEVQRQVPVPIRYRDLHFREAFRADLIVENEILLELKSVEQVSRVHCKQVLTYLKLMGLRLGFLLNFGAPLLKDGIERIVLGYVPTSARGQ